MLQERLLEHKGVMADIVKNVASAAEGKDVAERAEGSDLLYELHREVGDVHRAISGVEYLRRGSIQSIQSIQSI
jgi:hypothetical protein